MLPQENEGSGAGPLVTEVLKKEGKDSLLFTCVSHDVREGQWLPQHYEAHLCATELTAGPDKADKVLYPVGLECEEQEIWSQVQESSALPGGMDFCLSVCSPSLGVPAI